MCKSCLGANEKQGWLKPNIGYLCSTLPGVCDLAGGHSWGEEYVSSSDCTHIDYVQDCTVCGQGTWVRTEETGNTHTWESIVEPLASPNYYPCIHSAWTYDKCTGCEATQNMTLVGPTGHVYSGTPGGYDWRCIYCGELSDLGLQEWICHACGRVNTGGDSCSYCSTAKTNE